MEFYDALNWRYATKKMNGNEVPEEKADHILDAIQLAPTSMGLQPFTVFVIKDQEMREQILEEATQQKQVVDGSHLLVFAAWDKLTDEQIDAYVNLTAEERDLSLEELEPLRKNLNGVAKKSEEDFFNWAARQMYIAFGFGLAAAGVEEVDATPMEGFNNAKLDELLNLREQGMRSVSIMPLGYRDEENDWLAPMKKVRRPKDELFVHPEVGELV